MKKHKTLLVSCFIEDSPQAMPLATSLLKSFVLPTDGLVVEILNFTIDSDPLETAGILLGENPDSIGFSIYLWNSSFFETLAGIIREKAPAISLYAGGAEVTASCERLKETGRFDYLLPGEGEYPFRTLMSLFVAGEKPENTILEKKHVPDLELIPSPYLNGLIDPAHFDGLLWELSRGCPYNCSFCCESRGIGGVRYYQKNRIIKELRLFEKRGVEQIWVLDPTFNIRKERALEILHIIEQSAPLIHFTFEVRAELLDEEQAEAFSRIHGSLQIGLQSCHDPVLNLLNRSIDAKDFSDKTDLLNKYEVVFGLDLIYGLPGDSLDGFMESMDFAVNRIPNHLDIFRLSVFPGTELYDRADSLGLFFSQEPPYEVLGNDQFTDDDLAKAEEITRGADLFYNKGKSAPWLLPLLDVLEMKAGHFFQLFSDFIDGNEIDETNIISYQSDFLIQILSNDFDDDLLSVSMDLLLFHHLYNNSLYGEIRDGSYDFSQDMAGSLKFSRNTTLQSGVFSFDVTLYYELGMFDFNWFVNEFDREVSYGLLFNSNGEIQVMSVDKVYFQFLQVLDGEKTVDEVLRIINAEADEMQDFISFLVENKLIRAL
ncbi:MAG: DUF4080 domain-containing protein [Spirochaetales bacterium]|nr:DUF4080 domain-containing protein [Spirochaetales bacterium]